VSGAVSFSEAPLSSLAADQPTQIGTKSSQHSQPGPIRTLHNGTGSLQQDLSGLPAVLPAVDHLFEFNVAIGVHRIVEGSWSPLEVVSFELKSHSARSFLASRSTFPINP
jgi:hypothetical protein